MTPDLFYLSLAAILTAVLWIPFVTGDVIANGWLRKENYAIPGHRPSPPWVQRAHRAYINSIETLVPFGVLILVAKASGQANETTAFWAAIFFWARLGHAIVHISGVPYLRTLLFMIGFSAIANIFLEIV